MTLLSNIWKTFFGGQNINTTPEIIEVIKPISRKKRIEMQKTKTLQVKKHLIEKAQ